MTTSLRPACSIKACCWADRASLACALTTFTTGVPRSREMSKPSMKRSTDGTTIRSEAPRRAVSMAMPVATSDTTIRNSSARSPVTIPLTRCSAGMIGSPAATAKASNSATSGNCCSIRARRLLACVAILRSSARRPVMAPITGSSSKATGVAPRMIAHQAISRPTPSPIPAQVNWSMRSPRIPPLRPAPERR